MDLCFIYVSTEYCFIYFCDCCKREIFVKGGRNIDLREAAMFKKHWINQRDGLLGRCTFSLYDHNILISR